MSDYSEHCSFDYDEAFSKITNLKYLPWVGKNYSNAKNKILVVAESIYNSYNQNVDESEKIEQLKKLNSPEYARWVIKEQGLHFTCNWPENSVEKGLPSKHRKLTDNFSRVITGDKYSTQDQKLQLWGDVCFAELIQTPLDKRENRSLINKANVLLGFGVLKEIIKVIDPSKIIFIGNSNVDYFSNLVVNPQYHEKISGSHPRSGEIEVNLRLIPFIAIMHTSGRSFSWRKWHDFLETNA